MIIDTKKKGDSYACALLAAWWTDEQPSQGDLDGECASAVADYFH